MPREYTAGNWFQIILAAQAIVRGGNGGPQTREKLGNEDFLQHRLNAGPGKRRGELRLSGRLRQLPEQSAPAIKTTFRSRPILLADIVRHAARAVDDRRRMNGNESGEFGQIADVHGNGS